MLALRGDIPLVRQLPVEISTMLQTLLNSFVTNLAINSRSLLQDHRKDILHAAAFDADIAVLRQKQDNGADYIMTQLCWDMEQFKYWLDSIREAGVTMPVDVGVMPILDMSATINMALSRNGCVMDRELCRLISRNWLFPNPFAAKRC